MTKKKKIIVITIIIVFPFAYTIWDLRQAKNMAAEACRKAVTGQDLQAYLSAYPHRDYRVVQNDNEYIIVPKRGMGRYHCIITHDGRRITGSRTGFLD